MFKFNVPLRPVQFLKALAPRSVRPLGIVIEPVKLEQPENASARRAVRLAGKLKVPDILEQFKKASVPILVMPSCKINDVNEEQPLNTLLPINVMFDGISSAPVKPPQPVNIKFGKEVKFAFLLIYKDPFKPEQPSKTWGPRLPTLSGIIKPPVKPEQSRKARTPILVTLSGMVNEPVKVEQYSKALLPIFVHDVPITNPFNVASD